MANIAVLICRQTLKVALHAKDTKAAATQTSDISRQGEQTTQDASRTIEALATTVNKSAESVESLGRRSDEISKVTSVIKEIAEQTNLLALNAAIEAARAGESGRGFAVVADEVRKLAERTSSATLEITSLIGAIRSDTDRVAAGMGDASRQMHQGLELLGESSAALARIRETAEETLAKNSEISMAMQEQSHTSNDVAGNIQRIAEQNEQTSRLVAESAEIAGSLSQTASQLEALVGRFRITRG